MQDEKLQINMDDMIEYIKTNLIQDKDLDKVNELQANMNHLDKKKKKKDNNLSPHKQKNGLNKESYQAKPSPAKRLLNVNTEASVFDKIDPT